MIIDTSAILAVLFGESDAELYASAIAGADSRRISAANFVEAAIVVEAQTAATGSRQFDAFFRRAAIAIEPLTEEQAHIARQAYADFGKGRHPAALNFGDCLRESSLISVRRSCSRLLAHAKNKSVPFFLNSLPVTNFFLRFAFLHLELVR